MRELRARHLTPTALAALTIWSAILAGNQASPGGAEPSPDPSPRPAIARCPDTRAGLAFYRSAWERWHRQTGAPTYAPTTRPRWCRHARHLAAHWRDRARAARARFERWHARTLAKWQCIHEHEGAWNDPDPPYFGGLQFSAGFELAYGRAYVRRWGHANHWPVWAQLVAAERGWRDRGYQPWPTHRHC